METKTEIELYRFNFPKATFFHSDKLLGGEEFLITRPFSQGSPVYIFPVRETERIKRLRGTKYRRAFVSLTRGMDFPVELWVPSQEIPLDMLEFRIEDTDRSGFHVKATAWLA